MTDSFRLLLRRSCMAAAFADRIPIILRDFHASIKRVCVESERFMSCRLMQAVFLCLRVIYCVQAGCSLCKTGFHASNGRLMFLDTSV